LAYGGDQGGVSSNSRWLPATIEAGGQHVCLPSLRWPTSVAAASDVPSGKNWTKFDQCITAPYAPMRKRQVEEDLKHGHDQHTEASSAGLEYARTTSVKRHRAPASEIVERTNRIQEHLLRTASDGQPLFVRKFYESYRRYYQEAELPSTRLRFIVKRICNETPGVEYLMLKDQNEMPLPEFVPSDKKVRGQPPQTLAGSVALGNKTLHYYRNSVPRAWDKPKREQVSDVTHANEEVSETFSGEDDGDHNAGDQVERSSVPLHCHHKAGAQDGWLSVP
jgi:hypothetical protein